MAEEYLKRVKLLPGKDEDFDTLQLLYNTLNKQKAVEAKKAKVSEVKKDNLKKPN